MERSFEEVLKQFEPMIYHLINKYRIRDCDGDFYQEAIIALWRAWQDYDEKKMKFSSYAYFRIDKALLSLIRNQKKQYDRDEYYVTLFQAEGITEDFNLPVDFVWLDQIKQALTQKQWLWFKGHILEDKTLKTIAAENGVTENDVKNWSRYARKRLKFTMES